MKSEYSGRLNTEERHELSDSEFGIPEFREFPMLLMSGQLGLISAMLPGSKRKNWPKGL